MNAKTRSEECVRIRGAPPNLFAFLPLPDSRSGPIAVSFDPSDTKIEKIFAKAPPTVHLYLAGESGTSRLHLRLPRTIPPGIYRGTMQIEERPKPLLIEVEPRKRISMYPKRATISGRPGGQAELSLTLLNLGNIELIIPRVGGFGVFHTEGVDKAVGRTFQEKQVQKTGRVDRFMEALSDGYGGVIKLRMQKGSGALAPGQSREAKIIFHIPSQAVPGNRYWGLWNLHDYNFKVDLEVVADKGASRKEAMKK